MPRLRFLHVVCGACVLAAAAAAAGASPRGEIRATAPSASGPGGDGAQIRIRYEGGVNEPLGLAVVGIVEQAWSEHARRLSYEPQRSVTVELQTQAQFEERRVAPWAAGINDGTIRVPVQGLRSPTPALVRLLRHELAHSFVSFRTGGNCPTWLHEGIAQWLEGDAPERADAGLAAAAVAGTLIPLVRLERPFQGLAEADAALAYAESLSAVAHILRLAGEPGLVRLLAALGDQLPSEEALPVALALSYAELQVDWERQLRGKRR